MRRTLILASGCLLILCLFQASCEKRTAKWGPTDWDAVKGIIARYPSLFRLGHFDTEQDTTSFYREIISSHADIQYGVLEYDDPDYISLEWVDSLVEKLHYDSSGHPHQKPISFRTWTRAYFERWGYINDPDFGWLLRRISGTVVASLPTPSRAIRKLRVVSDGVDVPIPHRIYELVHIDSTLAFGKGKQVTFIVEPADTTDSLFLHVRETAEYQKIPFVREGEGSLSASWTTLHDPGPGKHYYHAIIDVVSQESLAADSTDYDAIAWGIVYRIE